MTKSKCTGPTCGKEIVWGEMTPDENGRRRKIPLDPTPPVFSIIEDPEYGPPIIVRDRKAMVSHFATCPDARQFSGSKKKEGA